jgi:hypothetical protein
MSTETSTETDASADVSQSLRVLHEQMEVLAHAARHLYSGAVRVATAVENPEIGLWSQPFKLHERARPWAKKNMVASTASLWQIHETLVTKVKKENRLLPGSRVTLTKAEAEILDLNAEAPVSTWDVLGRLPRFFV